MFLLESFPVNISFDTCLKPGFKSTLRTVLAIATMLGCDAISAQDVTGDLQMIYWHSRNQNEQRTLFETSVYVEQAITDSISGFVVGYRDQEFNYGQLGLARKFGNVEVGLGVGMTNYDDQAHVLANPWVYYSGERYDAYLHVEHYANERQDPWWYKAYLLRKFNTRSIGGYYDTTFGLGPRFDASISDHWNAWLAVPIWLRPDGGVFNYSIGVSVDF